MAITELPLERLDPEQFIAEQVEAIRGEVGGATAISALSGGVDSAVVTLLGHRALGDRLHAVFVENGLMREGEPQRVVGIFRSLGVPVRLVDASDRFFAALRGVRDPEEKREKGITQVFYREVFAELIRETGATVLLQGTIYTDIEETAAGVKRQHNVFEQIGIDPKAAFGYRVVEPLVRLRKPAVRAVARTLGLPPEISDRPPFPGPALAARVIGEVTRERVAIVRRATAIVEAELGGRGAFQVLAILHEVTGVRGGRRALGHQIEIRSWESADAVTARPSELPWDVLRRVADRILAEIPEVVSVTYNIATKPPSCIEAV